MAEENKKTTTKKGTTTAKKSVTKVAPEKKAVTTKVTKKTPAKKTTKEEVSKITVPEVETPNEEIKVEKKFCTNCGKELKDGVPCDCHKATTTSSTATINQDAIINTSKGIFNTIVNVFKKPDTTINEEMKKEGYTTAVILMIVLAVCSALHLMSFISAVLKTISDATYGLTAAVAGNISYFKVFIYGILIYALTSIIPMFAAFIIGKITRNSSFTFKKAFKLYTICNAPLAFAYLIMAVIYLIDVNLLTVLGIIGLAIVSLFCLFNYLLAFNKETTIREDRRSWALTSILIIWVIIELIAFVLILGSSATDAKINNNTPNYNDTFKW